jgi:hypothetical protein
MVLQQGGRPLVLCGILRVVKGITHGAVLRHDDGCNHVAIDLGDPHMTQELHRLCRSNRTEPLDLGCLLLVVRLQLLPHHLAHSICDSHTCTAVDDSRQGAGPGRA